MVSLYADDFVVFVAPVHQDIHLVHAILEAFAGASGLHTNIHKCQITPICCSAKQIEPIQSIFPCQLACFPCKYLGMPLSVQACKDRSSTSGQLCGR
jgi:hypothetical protein